MTYLDALLPLAVVLGVCVVVILICEVKRGIAEDSKDEGDS